MSKVGYNANLSMTGSVVVIAAIVILAAISLHYQSNSQYSFFRLNAASQMANVVPIVLFLIVFFVFIFNSKKIEGTNKRELQFNNNSIFRKPLFWIATVIILIIGAIVTSISIAKQTNSNSNIVRSVGILQIIHNYIPLIIILFFLLLLGFGYIKKKYGEKRKK
jgi:hypothetical protein